jgi:hypothetical protein
VASLRGCQREVGQPPRETERILTHALTRVWFSLLLGWAGGLYSQSVVIEEMSACVELMVLGAEQRDRLAAG